MVFFVSGCVGTAPTPVCTPLLLPLHDDFVGDVLQVI